MHRPSISRRQVIVVVAALSLTWGTADLGSAAFASEGRGKAGAAHQQKAVSKAKVEKNHTNRSVNRSAPFADSASSTQSSSGGRQVQDVDVSARNAPSPAAPKVVVVNRPVSTPSPVVRVAAATPAPAAASTAGIS